MTNKYFIKDNYVENLSPDYYQDIPAGIEYQHYVYQLAAYLAAKGNKKYIIDLGSGNGEKLIKYFSEFDIITVDFGSNSSFVSNKFQHISFNFNDGLPDIDIEILANSVVIASDVIEHIIEPQNFIDGLQKWSKIVPYLIISTPERNIVRGFSDYGPPSNLAHVREWSIQEFHELLRGNGFKDFYIGYTENTDFHKQKSTILALCGFEVLYIPSAKKTVLAIIHCYNEKDILVETMNHLLNQGIDICVIDNHSNDGTFEMMNNTFASNDRVYIRQSENNFGNDGFDSLLKNTERVSHEFSDRYEWFMHCDSDELRYSPFFNISLQDMISFVDSLSYNAIDFTVIDFRFTKHNNQVFSNYENHLLSFEFGRETEYFHQIKCWKYEKDINFVDSNMNSTGFSGQKVYPIKFLSKHYSLRNQIQANNFIDNNEIIEFKEHCLIRWDQNRFASEFLLERISGIGINIDQDIPVDQTNLFIQLFLDQGTGVNEENSIKLPVRLSREAQTFIFELTDRQNINNLRLDPLNESCVIEINELKLIGTDDSELNLISLVSANDCSHHGKRYLFETIDPIMNFSSINKNVFSDAKKFMIVIQYTHIGRDALEVCLKQTKVELEQLRKIKQILKVN